MGLLSVEAKGIRARAMERQAKAADGRRLEPEQLAQLIREELLTAEEADEEKRFAEELRRLQKETRDHEQDFRRKRLSNEQKRKELSLRWRHLEERRSARLDFYYAKIAESRSLVASRVDNVPHQS